MFSLTAEQLSILEPWKGAQDLHVSQLQTDAELPERPQAYYGAIGGELTYLFTPTSLGVVVRVKHAVTGAELDLTDYASW